MNREIKLEVLLFSERMRSRALKAELKKALKRVFELEFPQSGIRRAEKPSLRVIN